MPVEMRSDSDFLPSGEQWAIGHGRQQAIVTEVGATLRAFTIGGEPVIDGFGEDEWSQSGRGQVLAPWPNRLADGRYEFEGIPAQAPIDEPAHGNAIHGLVRWLPWQCHARAQNVVTLGCDLHPTPGYPFRLGLRIEYRLGRTGLSVTTTANNPGTTPIPFGLGFHPYLRSPVADRIDGAVLTLPARQRLVLDDRALPTGEVRTVTGTELDFTAGRSIGPTTMDTAFTDLLRSSDGRTTASLEDPVSGRRVELWADESFGYLMAYTGDTLPDTARRRAAVAIEPMTCPPNALRSHRDVIALQPGQRWEATWGIKGW